MLLCAGCTLQVRVDAAGFQALASLHSLRRLSLGSQSSESDSSEMVAHMSHLTALTSLSSLESLRLVSGGTLHRFAPGHVATLAAALAGLQHLELRTTYQLGDDK